MVTPALTEERKAITATVPSDTGISSTDVALLLENNRRARELLDEISDINRRLFAMRMAASSHTGMDLGRRPGHRTRAFDAAAAAIRKLSQRSR